MNRSQKVSVMEYCAQNCRPNYFYKFSCKIETSILIGKLEKSVLYTRHIAIDS